MLHSDSLTSLAMTWEIDSPAPSSPHNLGNRVEDMDTYTQAKVEQEEHVESHVYL